MDSVTGRDPATGLRLHSPDPRLDSGIAILGGGFGGICMAIRLVEAGRRDFVIYEKASSLGGTWRDNTYPGAACDVPSHLYSYSFAQRCGWTRRYAAQSEILAYIRETAERFGIEEHVVFNTPISGVRWIDDERAWRLSTADGRRFTSRVVVSAVGGLHLPAVPRIRGAESFAGAAFHTARWRHDVDLADKNVAVIGNGASAVQVVPEIAPQVRRLTVYQRTPQWILPRGDRPYSGLERAVYRHVPGALAASRLCHFWKAELRALAFVLKPSWMRHGQKRARRFLEASVQDPVMRAKLAPQYRMGCKRVLLSDTFYPALGRENVELVTDGIQRITPRGIVAADGVERPADAIVYATGFRPFNATDEIRIQGRDGRLLADEWRDGPRAFRGVAVHGYPNLFLIMGPNSGLGHNSILFMIEAQVRYILQCLRWLDRGIRDEVEVKAETQDTYNDMLDASFVDSVWRPKKNSEDKVGCSSWYAHAGGRNTAIWPGFATSYRLTMMRAHLAHFEPVRPREVEQPIPVPARRAA